MYIVAFLSKQLKCNTVIYKSTRSSDHQSTGLWVLCPWVHFLYCSKHLCPKNKSTVLIYPSNSLAPQSICGKQSRWKSQKRVTTQISTTNLPQSYILTPSSSWMLTSAPLSTRSFTLSKLPCLAAMCKEFFQWKEKKEICQLQCRAAYRFLRNYKYSDGEYEVVYYFFFGDNKGAAHQGKLKAFFLTIGGNDLVFIIFFWLFTQDYGPIKCYRYTYVFCHS